MAEKISMLIVVVDLDCHKCYHKIRKILCKLQDHERIQTISFDTKSKTVTIVGPFDPQRLACKLRCKGGKVVREVHIVDATNAGGGKPPADCMPADGPPPPPPVKNGKNKNKEKAPPPPPPPVERPPSPPPPPPPEPAPGPPPDQMPPPEPVHTPGISAMVPQPHYVEEKPPRAEFEPQMSPPPPPKEMPPPMRPMELPMPQHHPPPFKERPPPLMMPGCPGRPLEQPVPVAEYVIPTVEIPSWPAPAVGPCGCPCCAPCYQGYYDSCRCSCCGRLYGTTVRPLPPPCGGYRVCRTVCDDDQPGACSVM